MCPSIFPRWSADLQVHQYVTIFEDKIFVRGDSQGTPIQYGASQVALVVKNCLPVQGTEEKWVPSLGQEDPLEEEMATHSTPVAWRIPWTKESVPDVTKSQTWLSNLAQPIQYG